MVFRVGHASTLSLKAEKRFAHHLAAQQIVSGPLFDDHARLEHIPPVANLEALTHILFDQQDRKPPPLELDYSLEQLVH